MKRDYYCLALGDGRVGDESGCFMGRDSCSSLSHREGKRNGVCRMPTYSRPFCR